MKRGTGLLIGLGILGGLLLLSSSSSSAPGPKHPPPPPPPPPDPKPVPKPTPKPAPAKEPWFNWATGEPVPDAPSFLSWAPGQDEPPGPTPSPIPAPPPPPAGPKAGEQWQFVYSLNRPLSFFEVSLTKDAFTEQMPGQTLDSLKQDMGPPPTITVVTTYKQDATTLMPKILQEADVTATLTSSKKIA